MGSSNKNGENKYRDKAFSAISLIYDKTNNILEKHMGKRKGVAAGTAASLLSMGIERFDSDKENRDIAEEDENEEYNDGSEKDNKSHFLDRFLEHLVKHTIPDNLSEKDLIEKRINDPDRMKSPHLSIKLMASNFKRLSGTMTGLFAAQYGILHVITWKRPTKTLSFLILYTCLCNWPHLILVYPLVIFLLAGIVPGYTRRHPRDTPQFIKVKKRGQSLFEFLNQSEDHSVIADIVNESELDERFGNMKDDHKDTEGAMDTVAEMVNESPIESTLAVSNEAIKTKDPSKKKGPGFVKSQAMLLMNMRDLQNLTTDLLNSLNLGMKNWYSITGFENEVYTTLIFYGTISGIVFILTLGKYIPWRQIFIVTGWIALILCHPKSKKYIMVLTSKKGTKSKPSASLGKKQDAQIPEKKTTSSIIIENSPQVRRVEIFELHTKNLTNNQWSFSCYTDSLFDSKDPSRASGQKPNGAKLLSKVIPPEEWKFDIGYANKWQIDRSPLEFLHFRGIDNLELNVQENETEGWIYDSIDEDSLDLVYIFRRRRLYRDCFRYSVPPVKPKLF